MIDKLITKFPNDEELEVDFQKARKNAAADYTEWIPGYRTGSFFGGWVEGRYEHRPDIGAAKFDAKFPNGKSDFLKLYTLDGADAKDLCEKVDQLIEAVDKLTGGSV